MDTFQSAREAKEFLISKIVAEAQREKVLLSETERKMLYFSETGWTLPDMGAVSDEFDLTQNQNVYEEKITRLIQNAARYDRKQSRTQYDGWWQAIRVLKGEDHYILVMLEQAGLRPPRDLFRLWGGAAAIVGLLIGCVFLLLLLSDRYGFGFGKKPGSGQR